MRSKWSTRQVSREGKEVQISDNSRLDYSEGIYIRSTPVSSEERESSRKKEEKMDEDE